MSSHEGEHATSSTPDPNEHAGMDMDMNMGMSMSFHFGVSETILFDFWKTTDVGSLIGSIVLVFLLGVAYEGIKFVREYIELRQKKKTMTYKTFSAPPATTEGEGVPTMSKTTGYTKQVSIISSSHLTQTLFHFIQFVLSYFLMLIFMTYNVWLCLGVVFGATTGYFIFGWKRHSVVDTTDHCQ